ncbi:hypothetical protein CYMTET_33313, partial [Cymbomonas tetramitiformis]
VRLKHLTERLELCVRAATCQSPSTILPNLFIGNALVAQSVHTLEKLGITHVLTLVPDLELAYPAHFKHLRISVVDTEDEDIAHYFREAADFVETATKGGGKALVHCFEGKSRSATMVLAALMINDQMPMAEAYTLLSSKHPVSPVSTSGDALRYADVLSA